MARKKAEIPAFLRSFKAADAYARKHCDHGPEAPEAEEPEEPEEPDADADPEEWDMYNGALAEYEEALAEYEDDLALYESELSVYGDRIGTYMDACETAIKNWNAHGQPVTIYRAIVTKKKGGAPYINIKSLGKAWSIERDGARPQNPEKPPKWAGPKIVAVIQGKVSPADVDWEYGFESFLHYGESQWEFSVKAHVPIEITHIDDKKISPPVMGNSGDAQEEWTGKNPPQITYKNGLPTGELT